MRKTLAHLFSDHPREVGEGYFEHMAAASRYGGRLLAASMCAFVHALIPGLCKTTVSRRVCEMADEMGGRARQAQDTRLQEAGVIDPGL